MTAAVAHGSPADGHFQGRANQAHLVDWLPRPDENVNVFRHDDISPDGEVQPFPGRLEGVDKPLPAAVFREQGQSMKTGKGQFMGVARHVVTTNPLAVRTVRRFGLWGAVHAFAVSTHGATSPPGARESMAPDATTSGKQ